MRKLGPYINEIIPHRPEFSQLQVVGVNKQNELNSQAFNDLNENEILVNNTWTNPNLFDDKHSANNNNNNDAAVLNPYADVNIDFVGEEDPLASHPDVIEPPIFGPAVVFGGQTARWTGGDSENQGIVALESRLNFETKAGKRVLATFEIVNIGTTAIYYDWKKLPDTNPFDLINPNVQRFYFDTRSSEFSFILKSTI